MSKNNNIDKNNILYYIPLISYKILFAVVILTMLFNFLYVYYTKFKKVITVDEKHTYGSSNVINWQFKKLKKISCLQIMQYEKL